MLFPLPRRRRTTDLEVVLECQCPSLDEEVGRNGDGEGQSDLEHDLNDGADPGDSMVVAESAVRKVDPAAAGVLRRSLDDP